MCYSNSVLHSIVEHTVISLNNLLLLGPQLADLLSDNSYTTRIGLGDPGIVGLEELHVGRQTTLSLLGLCRHSLCFLRCLTCLSLVAGLLLIRQLVPQGSDFLGHSANVRLAARIGLNNFSTLLL